MKVSLIQLPELNEDLSLENGGQKFVFLHQAFADVIQNLLKLFRNIK